VLVERSVTLECVARSPERSVTLECVARSPERSVTLEHEWNSNTNSPTELNTIYWLNTHTHIPRIQRRTNDNKNNDIVDINIVILPDSDVVCEATVVVSREILERNIRPVLCLLI
jgi:hypothetical protein